MIEKVIYDNFDKDAIMTVKLKVSEYTWMKPLVNGGGYSLDGGIMMKSALWFYQKLKVDLESYDFSINPYNPCVPNAIIKGKQMTVTWYVDNLKVSHEDPAEITKFANYLAVIYGKKLTQAHSYMQSVKMVIFTCS